MEKLFSEFAGSTKFEWLEKVKKDLKGKSIDSLDWYYDDIILSPFHFTDTTSTDISKNGEDNSWKICESIDVSNAKEANLEIHTALNGGCTAISIFIDNETPFDFKRIFKGVQLDWIFIEFILKGKDSLVFVDKLLTYVESRGINADSIKGILTAEKEPFDPKMFEVVSNLFPNLSLIKINASKFTEGTTSELSILLKKTSEILGRHTHKASMARSLCIETKLTDNYFGNISKVRAIRLLLQNMFDAFELEGVDVFISVHVDSSDQKHEENYNIIRSNTQGMAAIIGGADMLNIEFKNHKNGIQFSKRIARNISHMMELESYMGRVKDPGSGSYFIEHLTEQLCEVAWKKFQDTL